MLLLIKNINKQLVESKSNGNNLNKMPSFTETEWFNEYEYYAKSFTARGSSLTATEDFILTS